MAACRDRDVDLDVDFLELQAVDLWCPEVLDSSDVKNEPDVIYSNMADANFLLQQLFELDNDVFDMYFMLVTSQPLSSQSNVPCDIPDIHLSDMFASVPRSNGEEEV